MKKLFMFLSMPLFDGENTAAAAPVEAAATNASTAETTVVDGVDLTKLTTDQLATLSDEEFKEFYAVVKRYINKKSAEKFAEFKAKIAPYWSAWTTYITGPGKWIVIAIVGAKAFGWI